MNTQQITARVPGPSTDFDVAKPVPSAVPAVIEPKGNGATPALAPAVTLPQTGVANIAKAISAVMSEIGIIGKNARNEFHKYQYAKMEDILQRLTPLMAKNGIVVFQTELDRSMFDDERAVAVRYAFTICHSSGEVWPERPIQTGVSRCRDSKNNFDDKALNKAHTAARKYFLLALFQIPTGGEDDADHGPYDAPRRPERPPVPSPSASPVPTGPHAVPSAGHSFATWARAFLNETNAVTAPEVAASWVLHNITSLRKLQGGAPDIFGKLMSMIPPIVYEAIVAANRPEEPPPSDQGEQVIWDETEERPATAEDHDPATGEVCPAYATDPEGHFQFVAAKLREQTTRDGLNDVWGRWIETVADIFPPDKSALSGVMKVCWNKLAS